MLGLRKLSKYEEQISNDPKRITKYNAFQSNISYAKLRKNNINISPSIAYRRPETKMYVGGDTLRTLKNEGGRAKSTIR